MTRHKGPGKADREGISLKRLMAMFPTDDRAQEWFEAQIWPQGPFCPHCGSFSVQHPTTHKSMTHRCRDCPNRPLFSLRIGTLMEGSKLGYQTWAVAIYLCMTGLKGVSSMKLHRDLEITRKSAWHLAHRIRKAMEGGAVPMFSGPAEADETCVGGKRKNMPNRKRNKRKELAGRGTVGKTAVAGVKDRETDATALQSFVRERAEPGATLYTDEARACAGMSGYAHEAVNHSAGEHVRDMAHTNGMESFRAMLKRGCQGAFHKFGEKHLDRHVGEFAGRHDIRNAETEDRMAAAARQTVGRLLRYRELIADNGLPSGARS